MVHPKDVTGSVCCELTQSAVQLSEADAPKFTRGLRDHGLGTRNLQLRGAHTPPPAPLRDPPCTVLALGRTKSAR